MCNVAILRLLVLQMGLECICFVVCDGQKQGHCLLWKREIYKEYQENIHLGTLDSGTIDHLGLAQSYYCFLKIQLELLSKLGTFCVGSYNYIFSKKFLSICEHHKIFTNRNSTAPAVTFLPLYEASQILSFSLTLISFYSFLTISIN